MRRATEAPRREDSAELLGSLVDLLPASMIIDAFDAALRLRTAVDRAKAVAALAPRVAVADIVKRRRANATQTA